MLSNIAIQTNNNHTKDIAITSAVVISEKECFDVDDDSCEQCPTQDDDNVDHSIPCPSLPTSLVENEDENEEDLTTEDNINTSRLEICASIFVDMSESEKELYIRTFVRTYQDLVTTIHISGQQLQNVLRPEQIIMIMKLIHELCNVNEYFCFYGGCPTLTSDVIGQSLPPQLHVLILWHFPSLSSKEFAAALRLQSSLQRLTLNFTCGSRKGKARQRQLSWGCLDVVVMACACLERLLVLQIRCVPTSDYHIASKMIPQEDSIITPEAMAVLLNSPTITQLYLENCGLVDDHMDEVYNELPKNQTLVTLDLKGNMFTDDCLYTTGRLLPIAPCQLQCLDLSGVHITNDAGMAVANGMLHQNYTIQSIEFEGTIHRFQDEFHIPIGHTNTEWMQTIDYQLRLNRAYQTAYEESSVSSSNHTTTEDCHNNNNNNHKNVTLLDKQHVVSTNVASFVAAVSSVSDNEGCMYHFLRTYPNHCNRLVVPLPHVEHATPMK